MFLSVVCRWTYQLPHMSVKAFPKISADFSAQPVEKIADND